MSKRKGLKFVRMIKLVLRPDEDPAVMAFWEGIEVGRGAEKVVELTRAYLNGTIGQSINPTEDRSSETNAAVDALVGML